MNDFPLSDIPTLPGVNLLRQIGRGNTSRVFAGKLEGKSEQYAIKVPTPETLADHAAAERFANEVRLSLQLSHPNLVRGVSGVAFGPHAYLAMPRYREGTLADQQEAGRNFSTPELLSILADIAAGMEYLHAQGGVHQDIKPQNVYLSGNSAALGDFGSTYLAGGKRSVSGSPFYMSPEIYHGQESSAASDVYSFGVMCYELLTGQRPHQGSSYEELMLSHLNHFPTSVAAHNDAVPRNLSRLIEQSMAKKAAERPNAQMLHQALTEARKERSSEEANTPGMAATSAFLSQPQTLTPETPAPQTETAKLGRASLQVSAEAQAGTAAQSHAVTATPPETPEPNHKKGLLSRLLKR